MKDFKKEFNHDDPVLKVEEDTSEDLKKDIKTTQFVWKMI